ncbi:hypothetical protein KC315_g2567 [Hortaea werneckii]|nr:hypothetical protein KC315_g2567 [Hortaea werneckii]KAI7354308.1 hypothetical protein KC354_g11193 [Hortaea werneckii]KAI7553837.1 hypothetical protein KC331_g958 [Hortaea werneckii]KAI7708182.1 hypothetical protein KC353_g11187 [Hortaea werneckii]
MRVRNAAGLIFLGLTAFLFLARHHLRDLSDVATTYATYQKLIQSHPELLYRYDPSPPKDATRPEGPESVPRIIHQIYLQEGRNSSLNRYSGALASCQKLHADWSHMLWTDDNGTAFIRKHYPTIAPHYEHYAQSIQRANILRYALLDHFGGVYLDLDVSCLQPFDDLRQLPFLTPGAYPAGVNNAFILARPHHPFLTHLLEEVPRRDMKWPMPYVENMLSTGCMYFTNRWMTYVQWLNDGSKPSMSDEQVYILADTDGNIDHHMLRGKVTTPLFAHGGASSWHGWDAAAIVLIGKHYCLFLALVGLGIAMSIAIVWKLMRRNNSAERQSPSARSRGSRGSIEKLDDEEKLLFGKDG